MKPKHAQFELTAPTPAHKWETCLSAIAVAGEILCMSRNSGLFCLSYNLLWLQIVGKSYQWYYQCDHGRNGRSTRRPNGPTICNPNYIRLQFQFQFAVPQRNEAWGQRALQHIPCAIPYSICCMPYAVCRMLYAVFHMPCAWSCS